MTTPDDVLKIANDEIGTRERAPNTTKYNDWYYGKRGLPWCAMFVSYCFHEAKLPLPAETDKGFALTSNGAKWFKKDGRWAEKSETPKRGYVVFYDWPHEGKIGIEHVGIVESVNKDGSIETIEGNTGPNTCCVMSRHRTVSDGIVGYGIPNYSEEDDMPSIQEVEKVVSDMYRLLARGEIDGKRSEAHYEVSLTGLHEYVKEIEENMYRLLARGEIAGQRSEAHYLSSISYLREILLAQGNQIVALQQQLDELKQKLAEPGTNPLPPEPPTNPASS